MNDAAHDALHASILSTLALAEAESCPALSHDVIATYLHASATTPVSTEALPDTYAHLVKNNLIRVERERYALPSHGYAFHAIDERHKAAQKKLEDNEIPLLLLQAIPFVHTMAVTGSVSLNNATPRSDVDIFCVANRGRLWTVRAFALALAALFLRRREHALSGEKLCFNYFLAHDADAPVQNIAAAHMFARALPLFEHGALTRFFAKNTWIADHLRYPKKTSHFPRVAALRLIARLLSIPLSGSFGDRVEQWLKSWQIRRLERKVEEGTDTSHFILRDDAILLHYPHSKNKTVMNHYAHRMRALGIALRD